MEHSYGWRPSLPDSRDEIYGMVENISPASALLLKGGVLPSQLPPIWDQLQIGSCTSHGSLRVYLTAAIKAGMSLPMLSRLMQYFDSRSLENTTSYDSGASVRDSIKALAQFGCCPESEWPYDISRFTERPPDSCYTDAQKHMAIRYKSLRVRSLGAPLRTALANGDTFTFGFPVPDYFEDGSWDPASGEPLPLPGPSVSWLGGHCVTATYYDFSGVVTSGSYITTRQRPFFTCDNSWGAGWGMAGRFNVDYEWFDAGRGLASDLWVIQKVT